MISSNRWRFSVSIVGAGKLDLSSQNRRRIKSLIFDMSDMSDLAEISIARRGDQNRWRKLTTIGISTHTWRFSPIIIKFPRVSLA